MKIDFSKILIGLDGEAITEFEKEEPTIEVPEEIQKSINLINQYLNKDRKQIDIHLRKVCFRAMKAQVKGQENMEPEEKYKRGKLAERIFDSTEPLEITPEELKMIREQIGKVYSIDVMAPCWDLLDVKEKAEEK